MLMNIVNFRPTESYEDLQNLNQALQEALANQQLLEDRILQVSQLEVNQQLLVEKILQVSLYYRLISSY
jgi:hypothetical protein